MEALIAVTYRCNAHCHMCDTRQHPSLPDEELKTEHLRTLPQLEFANITGAEPFMRDDLSDIVAVLQTKARRIVVSINGYFTERIIALAHSYRTLGFRISLEGLPAANDKLRGLKDGFDHGLRSLLELRALDVIQEKDHVAANPEKLAHRLLRTRRPKNWFRAWFNMGLANYVRGGERLLPCGMGTDVLLVDPFARVLPCNRIDPVTESLKEQTLDKMWSSEAARQVRAAVANCTVNCWMAGSVCPPMKKHLGLPVKWVINAKLGRATGVPPTSAATRT